MSVQLDSVVIGSDKFLIKQSAERESKKKIKNVNVVSLIYISVLHVVAILHDVRQQFIARNLATKVWFQVN